ERVRDTPVEDGQSDRARRRRTVPRVPVLELAGSGGEGVVDVLPAQHGGQWRIAGAEALPAGDDVRLDRHLLVAEPAADPTHPGDDLVEDDEEPVPPAPLREPLP